VKVPVELPDISTKEKAQQFVGLPMNEIRGQKNDFLKNTLPEWLMQAAERESKMGIL
jgi:nitrite reductase (cytochrome c-552)